MKTTSTASASTSTASTTVNLRFTGGITVTRTPDLEFNSATLIADAKARVKFLRSAHELIIAGDKTVSAANFATRVAINAPRSADLARKMIDARKARDEREALMDALADMFIAVPTLAGQEYGKTADGDSVNGEHIATVVWGALTKGAAKAHLKALV